MPDDRVAIEDHVRLHTVFFNTTPFLYLLNACCSYRAAFEHALCGNLHLCLGHTETHNMIKRGRKSDEGSQWEAFDKEIAEWKALEKRADELQKGVFSWFSLALSPPPTQKQKE